MDATIEYHRLLVGAFETEDPDHESDEVVIGNRWSFHDLNSYIREHETWFHVTNHSALGGCCAQHPPDTPIFPEVFSFEKLLRLKERLGSYHFSCQFLNNPASPENADFREEWLSYFSLDTDTTGRQYAKHEVKDGIVRKDTMLGHLSICMVSDPNHAGNAAAGRCRHSIVVLGQSGDGSMYLLDCWAAHASYDTYIGQIYKMADKWKLRRFGLETVAAQKYLAYHIQYRNLLEGRTLKIIDLNGEVEAPDGTMTRKKEWRIRNVLSPIFESGRFFIQRRHQDFLGEYISFPKGKFCDILDAMAYGPQMLKTPYSHERSLLLLHQNQMRARQVNRPYAHLVH
jgi:phage terminase large subunit-like protein